MDAEKNLIDSLKGLERELEGIGARAILNYVIFEFSVGGPSQDVINEALDMATREMGELRRVIDALERIRKIL